MIELLIVLIILGVVWYMIETFIPIAEPFRTVIRVVIVLILIVYLLNFAGILNIPMGRR